VQLAAGVNVLVPTLLVKLTVPVGVVLVPAELSVTVTVQVVPWLIATVVGVHETAVRVARSVSVRVVEPLLPV